MEIVRSTDVTKVAELAEWCRFYHLRNPWPADFSKRFAIGFYQIHDGFEWTGSPANVAESFCGAAVHFLITMEALQLSWAEYLPVDVKQILYENSRNTEGLLCMLSRAQRHILYASQAFGVKGTVKTSRTTRYNPIRLAVDLSWCITRLFAWVPVDHRSEGIQAATHLMTVRI